MIRTMIARIGRILPLATATILFVALLVLTARYRNALDKAWKQRDEARQALRDEGALVTRLLAPGDTLPAVTLVDASGDHTTLRDLPPRLKYVYFERQDCPPCQILAQLWPRLAQAKRDSIAFIEYDTLRNLLPVAKENHYAWVHDTSDTRRFVHFIPTGIVRDESGRVLTAAHGSLPKLATLFDMFGLVRRGEIDELVTAARARRDKSLTSVVPANSTPLISKPPGQ